jgi:prepilin-type N-terminal cleavage/methylation domain-containing protein
MRRQHTGFTLVEIAIVLVIIGLLLGGILKGQELINSARVRKVADEMTSERAAVQAFFDRYQALPGDYGQAAVNIPNVDAAACGGANAGNGDGIIGGAGPANEPVCAWHELAQSGFLNGCSACSTVPLPGAAAPTQLNSPVNSFGGTEIIQSDITYYAGAGAGAPAAAPANQIHSGNQIPSNVLGEVDRKIDDGSPLTGSFRFSTWSPPAGPGLAPTVACIPIPAGGANAGWAGAAPVANCGASLLLN